MLTYLRRGDKPGVTAANNINGEELDEASRANEESFIGQTIKANNTLQIKTGGIGGMGNQSFKNETINGKAFSVQDKVIFL